MRNMKSILSVSVPLFIALLVRVPLIDGSFWLDEAAQVLESMRPLSQQLDIGADFQPPLFHVLVHLLTRWGVEEWWLRLASLIPGLVTIFFTYRIGMLFGKTEKRQHIIGFLSSMLLSLSAFHVYFSQELRPYALAACWATISWYVLLRAQQKKMWNMRDRTCFIFCSIAGLYTMYVYPFLLISQFAFLVFSHTKEIKKHLQDAGWITLGFLPWVPYFLFQLKVGRTLQHTLPGWSTVVSTPQWKALPLVLLKFFGGGVKIDMSLQDIVYFGVPIVFLSYAVWKSRHTLSRALLLWLGLSLFLAWLVSFIVPVLAPKRVLFVLPAFFLLITQAILSLKQKSVWYAGIALCLVYQGMGLVSYWTLPYMQREGWRESIAAIRQQYSAGTSVAVFGFTEPFAPWIFYERNKNFRFPTASFSSFPLVQKEVEQSFATLESYKTILIFDYLRDLTDPSRLIESWVETHGFEQKTIIQTKNMGFIRVYERNTFISVKN
ncbi:MAG: hypothetical protein HZA34_01220 [Candidatus Pacebacteria bacterium]|nr:hypothetical protein [Candidatus Paceibacterota bacterium]